MIARVRKSMEEKDRGFTLIELLVVMIIIGVLAAIAVPVFLSQRAKARLTSAKSDATVIGKEFAAYYVDGSAALTFTGTPVTGANGSWTMTTTSPATTVGSGRLSPNNTAVGNGTATGTYCVVVGTGTAGDGYVTVTSTGIITTPGNSATTVPTSCTAA